MKLLKITLTLLIIGSITAFVMKEDDGGTLDKKIIKKIHKHWSWRQVSDSLFFSNTEISNIEYKIFLRWLREEGRLEEADKYKVDSVGWRDVLSYNEPMVQYYHSHYAYSDYPVVNITHEAAMAYCDYVTIVLNRTEHKHFFTKVKVRLPTRKEWTKAARGGRLYSIYPWGGSYCRNSKGCFLANFKSIPEENLQQKDSTTFKLDKTVKIPGADDKHFITAPVTSYFPNGYGLYNTSGNVAEMLNEPGKTIGGSWGTTAYYLRLDIDTDPYKGWTKPSPFIGFRPVMEVIEE